MQRRITVVVPASEILNTSLNTVTMGSAKPLSPRPPLPPPRIPSPQERSVGLKENDGLPPVNVCLHRGLVVDIESTLGKLCIAGRVKWRPIDRFPNSGLQAPGLQ